MSSFDLYNSLHQAKKLLFLRRVVQASIHKHFLSWQCCHEGRTEVSKFSGLKCIEASIVTRLSLSLFCLSPHSIVSTGRECFSSYPERSVPLRCYEI